MGIVGKTTRWAGTGAALAVVLKSVVKAEWEDDLTLARVRLFGVPVYDAKRREARLARRAARRARRD